MSKFQKPKPDHSPLLSISDQDLRLYIEGHLSPAHRSTIEGYLACNPDLAAHVMRAMHEHARARTPFRMFQRRALSPARRLSVISAIVCAILGWALAESMDDDGPFRELSSIPDYVDDAIQSQRVSHMRSSMHSQVETPALDSVEIERATRIRLPALPADWRLLDTQVFPSEAGPSISVRVATPGGETLNLFAVRADTSADAVPVVATERGERVAYWEADGDAYVLTGSRSDHDLLAGANLLSPRLLSAMTPRNRNAL